MLSLFQYVNEPFFSRMTEPVWTDSSMDATGMWFLDQEVEMDTENYQDMRRFGSWVPPDSVLNVNGTTSGCLEMTKSGLLNVKLDESL